MPRLLTNRALSGRDPAQRDATRLFPDKSALTQQLRAEQTQSEAQDSLSLSQNFFWMATYQKRPTLL